MQELDNLFRLKPGEHSWQPVRSGSMAPEFLPGDEVCIEGLGEKDWKPKVTPGRVTVFYRDGFFCFHRVLSRSGALVYEKGDGNTEGSWIGVKRIIGIVVGHRRMTKGEFMEIPLVSYSRIRVLSLFIMQGLKRIRLVRLFMRLSGRVRRWFVTILG